MRHIILDLGIALVVGTVMGFGIIFVLKDSNRPLPLNILTMKRGLADVSTTASAD
jgi:hypothetical protein